MKSNHEVRFLEESKLESNHEGCISEGVKAHAVYTLGNLG